MLPAEPPEGQLPSLAAAHLQAYTALIDCQLRISVLPADSMLLPAALLPHSVRAVLGSAAALSNTATVAGVASTLTSLVKRAVQFIRASAVLPAEAAAAGDPAACFSAATQTIAAECVQRPAARIRLAAAIGVFNVDGVGGAGGRQAAASAALLAVVLARNLVQLADAMAAAGPAVCARSLMSAPLFKIRWVRPHGAAGATYASNQVQLMNSGLQHSEQAHWQAWQVYVASVMQLLLAAFRCVGIAPADAATEDWAVAATSNTTTSSSSSSGGGGGDGAGGGDPVAAGGSSSSSSVEASSQHVKWVYLLRLQQINPQWAAALAAYEAKQQDWQ
jgi:hypothetical protein